MIKISIVIPAYNEEGSIETLIRRVLAHVPKEYECELLVVDDGSSDDTLVSLKALADKIPEVKYLSFSRNFGHQAALRAGLDRATGDAVISMDADLQHPPELLPEIIRHWREGYDIVYTRRRDGADTGLFKRISSRLFYKILNKLSGLAIEEGAADFRLLDRRVVTIIKNLPERQLFLRGFVTWCGFKALALDYEPAQRFAGKSKYSMRKMFSLGLQGITQFSTKPLRVASVIGFVSAGLGIVYGLFAITQHLLGNSTISGWTSVIIIVVVMSGVQLIVLGILGEYLGRVFLQVKGRPDYIIRENSLDE